jgi:hypothetical protein
MLEQRISSPWQHSAWNPHHAPLDPCTRKMIFGPVRPIEQAWLLRLVLGSYVPRLAGLAEAYR